MFSTFNPDRLNLNLTKNITYKQLFFFKFTGNCHLPSLKMDFPSVTSLGKSFVFMAKKIKNQTTFEQLFQKILLIITH